MLVTHVVKAKVAWQILGEKKFLRSTNLIEELSQHFVMRKFLGNLIVLHRKVFISTVSNNLYYPWLVSLEHSYFLFTIVHWSHSSLTELFFKHSFFFLIVVVRQYNLIVILLRINLVPDEAKNILRITMNVFEYLAQSLLWIHTFLVALVNDVSQLVQFILA